MSFLIMTVSHPDRGASPDIQIEVNFLIMLKKKVIFIKTFAYSENYIGLF